MGRLVTYPTILIPDLPSDQRIQQLAQLSDWQHWLQQAPPNVHWPDATISGAQKRDVIPVALCSEVLLFSQPAVRSLQPLDYKSHALLSFTTELLCSNSCPQSQWCHPNPFHPLSSLPPVFKLSQDHGLSSSLPVTSGGQTIESHPMLGFPLRQDKNDCPAAFFVKLQCDQQTEAQYKRWISKFYSRLNSPSSCCGNVTSLYFSDISDPACAQSRLKELQPPLRLPSPGVQRVQHGSSALNMLALNTSRFNFGNLHEPHLPGSSGPWILQVIMMGWGCYFTQELIWVISQMIS